jgi:hypothetical protein
MVEKRGFPHHLKSDVYHVGRHYDKNRKCKNYNPDNNKIRAMKRCNLSCTLFIICIDSKWKNGDCLKSNYYKTHSQNLFSFC